MLFDIITDVLGGVLGNPGQIGIAVALLASVLYWHKLTAATSAASNWMSKVVFAAFVIGLMLLVGIIPRIDVSRAAEVAKDVIHAGFEVLREVGLL